MTLKGRNTSLAEINKNSGAQQKKINENRPTLSAAKCRPVDLFSRNKVYADVHGGSIGEGRHVEY